MDIAEFRRGRRFRKRAFYRKCRIPLHAPRFDPSARNPMRAELDAYLEHWRLNTHRPAADKWQ